MVIFSFFFFIYLFEVWRLVAVCSGGGFGLDSMKGNSWIFSAYFRVMALGHCYSESSCNAEARPARAATSRGRSLPPLDRRPSPRRKVGAVNNRALLCGRSPQTPRTRGRLKEARTDLTSDTTGHAKISHRTTSAASGRSFEGDAQTNTQTSRRVFYAKSSRKNFLFSFVFFNHVIL